MKKTDLTRRAFIASSTMAAASIVSGCATKMNTAQVVPGKISPNEQLDIGVIGLGGRARSVVKQCEGLNTFQVRAASDCFQPRIDEFIKGAAKAHACTGYPDFRTMIEKEKLDGVMVETTTHARAWVTCWAMAMGMDVYIEKPMCLTIAEGRAMVKVARKYNRVTQVGTQQRSMPLNNWISDLVKDGAIGKVHTVRSCNFMGPEYYTGAEAQPMPDGGSEDWWDIWTNQAEMRPYHKDLHRGWSNWWDYDGGGKCYGVTGWGTHAYDQIQRGLGTDETGPVEVVLEEAVRRMSTGKFEKREISPKETGADYYGMAKQFGPRAKVSMKFKNGVKLQLDMDGDFAPGLGCIFQGEKGSIELNRNKYSCTPDALVDVAEKPKPIGVPETHPHVENWLNCIKSREKCTADIEYGQRSSTLCYLVNIVRDVGQVGKTLQWNPKKEQFRNCPEGNAMLSRPRRKGYELPS